MKMKCCACVLVRVTTREEGSKRNIYTKGKTWGQAQCENYKGSPLGLRHCQIEEGEKYDDGDIDLEERHDTFI